MYLVLWAAGSDEEWKISDLHHQREVAEAHLAFESLHHPTWKHTLVEIDAPSLTEEAELEKA